MSRVENVSLIHGLHHITLITSNEMINRRFYTEILGLHRVKLTVNQDDIHHRHLFYADEKGTTGSAITFFEWPHMRLGRVGLGSPHHLSYMTPKFDSLPKWNSWLKQNRVSVQGPLLRDDRTSIYLKDPDGVTVEITAPNEDEFTQDYVREVFQNGTPTRRITSEMKLTTFHHASPITYDQDTTANFFDKFLGLTEKFTMSNPDQDGTNILGIGTTDNPGFLRYLVVPRPPEGYVGEGSIHHVAMAVEDDEAQQEVLKQLNRVGINNSGIIDRFWFHSLYFRDPDGNLLEIATKNPGYGVDEPPEKLGTSLVLPSWLEPRREEIESSLKLTDANNRAKWPPAYPRVVAPPESVPSE